MVSKSNDSEKSDISEEKSLKRTAKSFMGYLLPVYSVSIAIMAIFAALICVVTMILVIPIPATQGFINIGDAIVMITALLFGPLIGALAGGIGSMFADLFLGYALYAPATLVIKGLEGFIVGLIANPKQKSKKIDIRDILGVIAGGLVMVFGYFFYEILLFGLEIALVEIFLNGIIQFGLGATLALLFTLGAREPIKNSVPQIFDQIFIIPENK